MYLDKIDQFVGVAFMFSLSLSPTIYFLKKGMDRRSSLENSKHAVLAMFKAIKNLKKNDPKRMTVMKDGAEHTLEFYPAYIGRSGLDSVIASGHFSLFPIELQIKLTNIGLRIDLNNKFMDEYNGLANFCTRSGIGENNPRYVGLMFKTWLELTRVQRGLFAKIEEVEGDLGQVRA